MKNSSNDRFDLRMYSIENVLPLAADTRMEEPLKDEAEKPLAVAMSTARRATADFIARTSTKAGTCKIWRERKLLEAACLAQLPLNHHHHHHREGMCVRAVSRLHVELVCLRHQFGSSRSRRNKSLQTHQYLSFTVWRDSHYTNFEIDRRNTRPPHSLQ